MDPYILKEQLIFLDSLKQYNDIPHVQLEKREQKLKEMLAEAGDVCYIESPFFSKEPLI